MRVWRWSAVATSMVVAGCGARSELRSGAGRASSKADAWACVVDGMACGAGPCCSGTCEGGVCGESPCRPGDPPAQVTAVPAEELRVFGWPGMVQGAGELYFGTERGGVFAVPKAGGEPRLVTRLPGAVASLHHHQAEGGELFATTFGPDAPSGHVYRVDPASGVTVLLAAGQHRPNGVSADATHVFWTVGDSDGEPHQDDGLVMRMPRGGGEPEVIASGQRGPWSIVRDGGALFWSNLPTYSGWTDGNIVAARPDGSSAKAIAGAAGQVWRLTVDASHVYFGNGLGGPKLTSVQRVPRAGGAVQTLGSGFNAVSQVAVDDHSIYLGVKEGTFDDCRLVRIPKGGGEAMSLVETVPCVLDVTVDFTCVYWSNDDTLWRIPRP